MSTIFALEQETFSRDMPTSATIGITLFMGAAFCGFWFFDLIQKVRSTEKKIDDLDEKLQETDAVQGVHGETLEEHDRRLREKKDFDDSEEIEENTYQAWKGTYHKDFIKTEINLCRKKKSSIQSNQQWTSWNGEDDSSVTVRDFYLGNLHPEFHWEIREGEYYFITRVNETFVESWESTIQLEIFMTFPSKQDLVEFSKQTLFNGDSTINEVLKRIIETKEISWEHTLIRSS